MTETNFIQPWLDVQKMMFDAWQQSLSAAGSNETQKDGNIFAQSMQPVHEALNKWVDFANDIYSQNITQLGQAYPQYHKLFENISSAAGFNQDLNNFWQDLQSILSGKDSDPAGLYSKWNQNCSDLILKQAGLFLPEQVNEILNKGIGLCTLSGAKTGDFFKPWLNQMQNMHNLLLKSITGDQSAYIEFVRLWQDNFSASFGKIFNIPQFSMNRELMQKQLSGLGSLITFINTLNEYVATLVKTSQDTLGNIVTNYQSMVMDGSNPKTYKEFYEYWWRQNEAAYLQLFGTAEFARLIAQLLDAGVNFKKNFDDVLEKQLEFLPYPTKTDMDSVYKTLYTLKREVRALKKEFAAFKNESGINNTVSKED